MQHLIDKLGGDISIHAPRTGSDQLFLQPPMHQRISIHAPRTGSDASQGYAAVLQQIFQSTLPARGATRPASLPT